MIFANEKFPRIVLASASPRRRELLHQAGIPAEIRPAAGEERARAKTPAALVKALFYGEGAMRRVEDALGVRGDTWPIGAEDVEDAIAAIARRGFAGEAYGLSLAEWEDRLFGAAREALPAGERAFLDPLEEFAHDKPFWRVG